MNIDSFIEALTALKDRIEGQSFNESPHWQKLKDHLDDLIEYAEMERESIQRKDDAIQENIIQKLLSEDDNIK